MAVDFEEAGFVPIGQYSGSIFFVAASVARITDWSLCCLKTKSVILEGDSACKKMTRLLSLVILGTDFADAIARLVRGRDQCGLPSTEGLCNLPAS